MKLQEPALIKYIFFTWDQITFTAEVIKNEDINSLNEYWKDKNGQELLTTIFHHLEPVLENEISSDVTQQSFE